MLPTILMYCLGTYERRGFGSGHRRAAAAAAAAGSAAAPSDALQSPGTGLKLKVV